MAVKHSACVTLCFGLTHINVWGMQYFQGLAISWNLLFTWTLHIEQGLHYEVCT